MNRRFLRPETLEFLPQLIRTVAFDELDQFPLALAGDAGDQVRERVACWRRRSRSGGAQGSPQRAWHGRKPTTSGSAGRSRYGFRRACELHVEPNGPRPSCRFSGKAAPQACASADQSAGGAAERGGALDRIGGRIAQDARSAAARSTCSTRSETQRASAARSSTSDALASSTASIPVPLSASDAGARLPPPPASPRGRYLTRRTRRDPGRGGPARRRGSRPGAGAAAYRNAPRSSCSSAAIGCRLERIARCEDQGLAGAFPRSSAGASYRCGEDSTPSGSAAN